MPILAELVTCPQCLDEVSRLLRLPPCAERHPGAAPPPLREGDAARRDRPRHTGYARRAAAAQRCRLVRAHRPRVLRMLVNGFEIGTHEINGTAARVTQTLSILEPVWLAEVYSEQDVCLASLDVTPLPEAPAEQRVDVALSDDRRIALVLSLLKPWPTLHLVYEDPAGAAPATAFSPEMADVEAEATDAPAIGAPAIGPAQSLTTQSLKHVFHAWRDWLRGTLRRPPRLAWWTAMILIAGWLFCFTPGTQVSAAERLWRAIAALFTREPGPISAPMPMPPGGPRRQQDISLAAPPGPRPPAAAPAAPLTPDALAELEIDALIVLHGRGALAGQRIQVTRSSTRVAVEGLVEGPDRDEIVRALREVPHGDALLVRLSTPADLSGRPPARSSPSSNLRAVTLGRDAIPAADDLRQALARRAPGGHNGSATNVEAEVHRLANEGLQGARTGFLEAALLSTLADRFAALSGPAMARCHDHEQMARTPGRADGSCGARGRSGAHAARAGIRQPRSTAGARSRVRTRAKARAPDRGSPDRGSPYRGSAVPGRRGPACRGRSRTGGTRHTRGLDGRGDAAGHYRAARCRVLASARGDARASGRAQTTAGRTVGTEHRDRT